MKILRSTWHRFKYQVKGKGMSEGTCTQWWENVEKIMIKETKYRFDFEKLWALLLW